MTTHSACLHGFGGGPARENFQVDELVAGVREGQRLAKGGAGAAGYADAVATYLGLGVSRTTDLNNSVVTWSSSRDQARNLLARQAIPMAWDFVEDSPFGSAAGDWSIATQTMARGSNTSDGAERRWTRMSYSGLDDESCVDRQRGRGDVSARFGHEIHDRAADVYRFHPRDRQDVCSGERVFDGFTGRVF
jgi:hypothetical protein